MDAVVAEVRAVSEVDDALRKDLLRCWTDVTNAGGAVGFVPPVTEDDVVPLLDKLLDGVLSGPCSPSTTRRPDSRASSVR